MKLDKIPPCRGKVLNGNEKRSIYGLVDMAAKNCQVRDRFFELATNIGYDDAIIWFKRGEGNNLATIESLERFINGLVPLR